MNTKTRLALLLGLLLFTFGTAIWSLHVWQDRQAESLFASLRQERSLLLDEVLKLTSHPVKTFVTDYSNWDEMLAFVGTADPAWAPINIDISLQTFNIHAAWVLRTDGSQVYGAVRGLPANLRNFPLPPGAFLERVQRERFSRFFMNTEAGLLEIRTAPIQPSSDMSRGTPAQGWLLAAQLWDADYQQRLGTVLDSQIQIAPVEPAPFAENFAGIRLQRDLAGPDNETIQRLTVDYFPDSFAIRQYYEDFDLVILIAFGACIIGLTLLSVSWWIVRPLRRLEESLARGSAEPLASLVKQKDEFGRLATLAAASFAHRTELEREIEDRKRIEAALLESEGQLRNSSELRTRLARDLHDNIIQSIYATGLGLENILRNIRIEPSVAEQQLEAVRQNLNQLIREIRSFITGLEPESNNPAPDFAQTLRALAATLQSLHPVAINLEIDAGAANRLTPPEEVHALQIVREGISNAIRHGGATRIDLRLFEQAGGSVLQIEDDGHGFDPATAAGRGSGLVNQTSRAREMGAILRIDSAPGDGTRLTLRFNHPSSS